MERKFSILAFVIVAVSCLSLRADYQPDVKFLNSVVILREEVLDLGEMHVKEYVEFIKMAERPDGTPAVINGWEKQDKTYKLNVDIGEPISLEFDYNGTTSQLQPIQTKRGLVSPMKFTMLLAELVRAAQIRAAQKEAEPIIAELNSLDTRQQQELSLLDKGVARGLTFVRTDIETWKQEQAKLSDKQKELCDKIGPVLTKRVELENSFDEKIQKLEFAKADFEDFKKNSLAAGAKIINDAIINKNLELDLLPHDGLFWKDPIRCVGHSDSDDAGSFIGVEYRFTIFANATEESLSRGGAGWDISSISGLEMGNETRGFFHFPTQIEDESVKKAFVKLYQDFNKRIRQEAGEKTLYELPNYITFKASPEEIEHQRNSSIQKFDYKNEMQSEDYQKSLSQFQEEMAELQHIKKQLADANEKVSRKEKVVNSPKGELQQALRDEIKQIFVEKRESLNAKLETIAEHIK